MKVISNNDLEIHKLPGLLHKTLSNKHNGGQEFEVWKQIIKGQSSTPVHKHNCDETRQHHRPVLLATPRLHSGAFPWDREFTEIPTTYPNRVHILKNTRKSKELLTHYVGWPKAEPTRVGICLLFLRFLHIWTRVWHRL